MTKAAQIMALWRRDPELSTRQLAEAIYGAATESRVAYVRVVIRQRKDGGESEHDRKYRGKNRELLNEKKRLWEARNREHLRNYERERRRQRREARA